MTYPQVIGEFETIDALLTGKSIARYGDGELKLMDGGGYTREPPLQKLADELLQVLQRPNKNCLVGVPTMAREGPKYASWLRHEERFIKLLRPDRVQYYSAFITRPDSAPWINTIEFATKVESLWRGKRVVVVSEPKNSIIGTVSTALSRSSLECPRFNAYAEIDRFENLVIKAKPELVMLSCGPTATCLANRLAARGIHAVDIGSAGGFLGKLLGKKDAVQPRCQWCRYWNTGFDRNGELGGMFSDCRRHGPISNGDHRWPRTQGNEGCGDFKAV